MTDQAIAQCQETGFFWVQMLLAVGVLSVYVVTLWRTRFAVWESMKIMIGWSDQPRSKVEKGLVVGVFLALIAALGVLFALC